VFAIGSRQNSLLGMSAPARRGLSEAALICQPRSSSLGNQHCGGMDLPFSPQPEEPPKGDPAAQAIASLRGYAYQLYASGLAWLSLSDGDDELFLEVAQDYATAVRDALAAVQVKDTASTVTIYSENARQALDGFVDLVERNPGRRVTLHFLSTASIGRELKTEHRVGTEPTLLYWDRAREGAAIAPLRDVLNRLDLTNRVKAFIENRSDEALRDDLVRRIHWDCGAPPLDDLKNQLEERLVVYAAEKLQVPPDEARHLSAKVLQRLFEVVVEPDAHKRKLTSADLLSLLGDATRISLARSDVDAIVRTGARVVESVATAVATLRTPDPLQSDIVKESLERDFAGRYRRALQRSLFPETAKSDQFQLLAKEILEGNVTSLSEELRRRILLRASRSAAPRNRVDAAQEYLDAALQLTGSEIELPAQARILVARNDADGAIRLLRDATDPESQATLLSILAATKGDEVALAWLSEKGLSVERLTTNGVIALCHINLRRDDIAAVKATLDRITSTQVEECPYLLFLRGAVRFASLLSKPDQKLALQGLQLDVRRVRPIVADTQVAAELDAASADLQRVVSLGKELGLRDATRVAEDYLVWFDLIHPSHRDAALARLRSDMEEPATALRRLQFAFAYDPAFNPEPIVRHLEKRESLGGFDDEELRAALLIALHGQATAPVAAFIAKHRAQLDATFGKPGIRFIEIQALAKSGDAVNARAVLNANRSEFDAEELVRLEAQIAAAEGADPVAEYKRAYESTKTADTLRSLIASLAERDDYRSIAPYAEQLHALTGDPRDISYAATAYARAGDEDGFVRVIEAHRTILDHNVDLARHYGWQLFNRGRLKEARDLAQSLQSKPDGRDLDLEIAIAIETGEWETLSQPLTACLQMSDTLPPLTVMRAAHLSQASGQGPLMDLVAAATAKGGDDPNVLLGAYTLYIEKGLEDQKDEAQAWFRRALELSGPDGPIQQFELKDILAKQIEWNERTRKINEGISRGDIPLVIGAAGLRTTIVDIVLRNFARNSALTDHRRRASIPLFSGRRVVGRVGSINRIALDLSAILVLGWLGLLPKVLDTFPEIVIPAGTFRDLFEGRRKIREYQKSRLQRAERIDRAIARGKLKIVRSSLPPHDALVTEVGAELAGLIRAAEAANGFVLRPAPIHRPGVEEMPDADISAHESILVDTHALLAALAKYGAVDQATEQTAKRYFALQDKGLPKSAVPDRARPLYIEGLGLIYLDTVHLLDTVLDTFDEVYIDSSSQDEASALIEHDRHVAEVLRVIDLIREAIRKAQAAKKIVFGPHRAPGSDDADGLELSTINLISDLMKSDAAVFDDRGLNKEQFVEDRSRHRAPTLTSLDLIEELRGRNLITDDERRAFRHRLRIAGAALVPVDADEITQAALRSQQTESAELRAIRDSVSLARVAEVPRFPAEIPWFASTVLAVKNAVLNVWIREKDFARAASMADAVLAIAINPEDWLARWEGNAPPDWIETIKIVVLAGLALPVELEGTELMNAYHNWLERRVLEPLRTNAPDVYRALVEHIRRFVNAAAEHHDGP
jgi:hypothetical protein